MVFGLPWPEITSIVRPLRYELSLPFDLSFHSIFLCFLVFLSSTCCGIWFCHCTKVDPFIGFCVGDLDDNAISIRQRSYIKSLFVSMFHQI